MTSSVNLWINIPSLSTGASPTNKNTTTTSDFTSYLLNATASLDKKTSTSNSMEALLPEAYEPHNSSSASLYHLFDNMNGHNNTSTMRTPTMSDYLQNAFQAQQFKTLSAAHDKLQTHMTNFAATINENSSVIDQQRLTKMKNNIALLNDYLTEQTNTAISTHNHLNALPTSASTSNNLLDILSTTSALSQYLLLKSNG